MWNFGAFFYVRLNKLLSKQSICHWLETPWYSCDVTVVCGRPRYVLTKTIWLNLMVLNLVIKLMILTHWSRDKMADTLQTTFSNAFSSTNMFESQSEFHWSLFPRVQLTISHLFRSRTDDIWTDDNILPEPMMTQFRDAYVSPGLNKLTHSSWTKWPPFHRRYFHMHFREWKVLYFD